MFGKKNGAFLLYKVFIDQVQRSLFLNLVRKCLKCVKLIVKVASLLEQSADAKFFLIEVPFKRRLKVSVFSKCIYRLKLKGLFDTLRLFVTSTKIVNSNEVVITRLPRISLLVQVGFNDVLHAASGIAYSNTVKVRKPTSARVCSTDCSNCSNCSNDDVCTDEVQAWMPFSVRVCYNARSNCSNCSNCSNEVQVQVQVQVSAGVCSNDRSNCSNEVLVQVLETTLLSIAALVGKNGDLLDKRTRCSVSNV